MTVDMNSPARTTWTRRQSGRHEGSRLNQVFFWLLVALLVLAPLPLGSARALFWGIGATYVGVVFALYAAATGIVGQRWRSPITLYRPAIWLVAAFLGFLALQLVPGLGQLPGMAITTQAGTVVEARQISLAPGMTLLMLMRHLTFALLAIGLLQVLANDRRRLLLLDLLLAAIVAYAAYAMVALRTGDTVLGMPKGPAYAGLATGPYLNRNTFATLLAMGTVLASVGLTGVLVNQSLRHADDGRLPGGGQKFLIYALALVFLVITLMATQSRMGQFSAAVGCVVAIALMLSKAGRARLRLTLGFVGASLLAAGVIVATYGNTLIERLLGVEQSAKGRFDVYQQTMELIMKRPLTGYGGGSYEIAYPLIHTLPADVERIWDRAHNTYLALWSDMGLVFGSIPILIVVGYCIALLAGLRRSTSMSDMVPQSVAIGAAAVVGTHSLMDFSLEISSIALVFVALLTCGAATLRSGKAGKGEA
jgi:O-antigen ligase